MLAVGGARDTRLQAQARYRQVARQVVWLGVKLRDALLEAGYSQSVADRGWETIRNEMPSLYRTISAEMKKYTHALEDDQLNERETKVLVRHKLITNVHEGVDRGVQSSKILAEIDGFKAPDAGFSVNFNSIPAAFQADAKLALSEPEISAQVLSNCDIPATQPTEDKATSQSTSDKS